jgi:lipid II:glycine glycyltransferase (peptidoglycan interpeptide bridge formation enzyme)
MLDIYSFHHFYHLSIGADKVLFVDFFRPACYSNYKGKRFPRFFKLIKRKTSIISLLESNEEMLSAMKSNTRNEIRRSIRDGYEMSEVKNEQDFIKFYNSFAMSKALPLIDVDHLRKYGKNLILTQSALAGRVLTMHASVIDHDSGRVFLLYSASLRLNNSEFKKEIGFSNRYLHFKDLEHFKELGCVLYDFSGVSDNKDEPEKYNIGLFKKGFGGKTTDTITLYSPLMSFLMLFRKKEND